MKTARCLSLIFSGTLLFWSITLSNATASLLNGSFEIAQSGSLPNINSFTTTTGNSIYGWTVESGNVDWVGTGYWNSSQGNYSVDMDGSMAGKIFQNFNTVVGEKYIVSFDLSGNPWGGAIETLQVGIVDLTEALLYSNQFIFNNNYNPKPTFPSFTGMIWSTNSFEFTATTSLTKIVFQSLTSGFYGPAIDNVKAESVSITSPIPEPATFVLLSTGLLGLAGYGRKKFKK